MISTSPGSALPSSRRRLRKVTKALVVPLLVTAVVAGSLTVVDRWVAGQDTVSAGATTTLTEVGSPFAARALLPFGGSRLDSGATGEQWSSAAVADVNGSGNPEVIVGGGVSSSLQVFGLDGSSQALVDVGGVNAGARSGGVQPSPVIADVNGDGVSDVVTGSTANVLAAYSFRGNDTRRLWSRQDPPIVPNGPTGFLATPALGYLQGDQPSVVTASWGQALGANNARTGAGLSGWPKWLKDSIWSSPAIGDIDGDGAVDVVVGGDCAGNDIGTQPCGNVGGGYVWAFNRDGTPKWNWFLRGQVIWSSPALGDLNGDGALDVVVGTGGYWGEPAGRVVTALNGRNGSVLWQTATPARVVGSPSLADVTGDGKPDVFVVSYGGWMLSYDGATGAERWRECITDGGNCGNPGIGTKTGVALADIDNDGRIEAVTHGEQQLTVVDAASGALEAKRGSSWGGTVYAPANTPTIAQVNGQTYIFQPLFGRKNGQDLLVVEAWRTGKPLGAAPWPTARGDQQRTGRIATATPDRSATEAFVSRVYRDFLSRSPSGSELSAWSDRVQRGQVSRYELATTLSQSPEWISTVITRFYRDTLRREPDASGLAGWVRAAQSGMPVAQIAAAFYASPEYFQNVGRSDNQTWVRDLYRKLLLREPDQGGVDGWVRALQAGMGRDTLAFGFYQAQETVQVRIDRLYRTLLGRPADDGAIRSWSGFVRDNGDLSLAAALAASNEYYQRRS